MDILKKIICIILLFYSFSVFSQEKKEEKPSLKDRFVFGGTLGAQFGSYTSVLVSPSIGFYATPKLLTGISLMYQYHHEKWERSSINTHIYGGSLFKQYTIYSNIGEKKRHIPDMAFITHLEYQLLNLDRDFSTHTKTNRYWLHGIYVGGGIKQLIGKKSALSITLLYNILWDKRSPDIEPFVIRVGFYL